MALPPARAPALHRLQTIFKKSVANPTGWVMPRLPAWWSLCEAGGPGSPLDAAKALPPSKW
jgi:hypothetical protein